MFNQLGRDPCAIVVESDSGPDSAIEAAKKIAKKGEALVAVRQNEQIEKRLLPAYINSYVRFMEGSMHSNSISLEMLLFVAGNMNIGNAVGAVAADDKRFIIFSSSRRLADSVIKKSGLKRIRELRLSLDAKTASDVAMTAIKDDK